MRDPTIGSRSYHGELYVSLHVLDSYFHFSLSSLVSYSHERENKEQFIIIALQNICEWWYGRTSATSVTVLVRSRREKKKKKEIFRRYLGQKCIKQDTEAWNERREDRQKCTKWPLDL